MKELECVRVKCRDTKKKLPLWKNFKKIGDIHTWWMITNLVLVGLASVLECTWWFYMSCPSLAVVKCWEVLYTCSLPDLEKLNNLGAFIFKSSSRSIWELSYLNGQPHLPGPLQNAFWHIFKYKRSSNRDKWNELEKKIKEFSEGVK